MTTAILLLAGLLLLILSGDFLIKSLSHVATQLKLPEILVSIVLVGFGTSLPELIVCIEAVLNNKPDLVLGNVIGSNLANLLLVLPIGALFYPVYCKKKPIGRDIVFMTLITASMIVLIWLGHIGLIIGSLMVVLLVFYLSYGSYATYKAHKQFGTTDPIEPFRLGYFSLQFGIACLSLAGLIFGADLLVQGASQLATKLGVSEAVIGLSVVAIGTSLPELAAAISATLKRKTDMIIGNIIGSNLFNILGILGISAIVKPMPISNTIRFFDMPLLIGVTIIICATALYYKKFNFRTSLLLLTVYCIYITYIYLA